MIRDRSTTAPRMGAAMGKVSALALVAAFAATAGRPMPAAANCVAVGTDYTCTGAAVVGVNDNTATTVTVAPGASVTTGGETFNVNGAGLVFDNDGTITSTGDRAIDMEGAGAALDNTGAILGQGGDGVRVGHNAQITNSGSIVSEDDEAIEASDRDGVSVFNSGLIRATASGDKAIEADQNLTVVNSGTIQSDSSEAIEADGGGLRLTNTGLILAPGDDAVDGADDVVVVNSGTILGGQNDAIELNFGSITNSGVIRSISSAPGETDAGVDFDASGGDGSVVNSGLIEGDLGIGVDPTNTGAQTVVNSGTIRGRTGTAISLGQGDDSLTVRRGSVIDGAVDLGAGDADLVAIDGPMNAALAVRGVDQVATHNGAVAFADLDAAGDGTIVTLDPTAIAGQDAAFADVVGGLSGALGRQFGAPAAAAYSGGGSVATMDLDLDRTRRAAFVEGFGGFESRDADGARVASDHGFFGGLVGVSLPVGALDVDVYAGVSRSDFRTEGAAQEVDGVSGFVGLQGARGFGAWTVGGGVTLGYTAFESDRSVNGGLETATAEYSGLFVAPELRAEAAFDLGGGVGLAPAATLGYAALFTESYGETGSSANLSVGDRTSHVLRGRAELGFPAILEERPGFRAVFTPRVGVEGVAYGGDDAAVTVFGQTQSVSDGRDDVLGRGVVGARLDLSSAGGAVLSADVEGGLDTDEGSGVLGRVRLSVPF